MTQWLCFVSSPGAKPLSFDASLAEPAEPAWLCPRAKSFSSVGVQESDRKEKLRIEMDQGNKRVYEKQSFTVECAMGGTGKEKQ